MAYEQQLSPPLELEHSPSQEPMPLWKKLLIGFLIVTIFISGALVFMAIVGWLGLDKHGKDIWVEVNSQILNGCFTFVAVVLHPMRVRNLYHIIKYRQTKDTTHLDSIHNDFANYPLEESTKRQTFLYIMLLFNVNSLFQYPIAACMWGWSYHDRPNIVVAIFLPLAMVAGTWAGIWQALIERRHKLKLAANNPSA